MINKIKTLSLVLALTITPISAIAQNQFTIRGEIYSIGTRSINLDDTAFNLLSTVKVLQENSKPGKLVDLKKGDNVLLNVITLDKRRYVDTIYINPEDD